MKRNCHLVAASARRAIGRVDARGACEVAISGQTRQAARGGARRSAAEGGPMNICSRARPKYRATRQARKAHRMPDWLQCALSPFMRRRKKRNRGPRSGEYETRSFARRSGEAPARCRFLDARGKRSAAPRSRRRPHEYIIESPPLLPGDRTSPKAHRMPGCLSSASQFMCWNRVKSEIGTS
jgi:hypothetical protein